MAARRQTTALTSSKSTSAATKISKSGNDSGESSNASPAKKTTMKATVVKSRYMQAAVKSSLSKSNSSNDTVFAQPRPTVPKPGLVKPRVGSSPRRTMAPRALGVSTLARETEPSVLGESMLQSTFSDGHCIRPDFDVSVIKDKNVTKHLVKNKPNPEEAYKTIEMDTLILAYITAKVESNTAKLKRAFEEQMLQKMEEEEALRKEVHDKKRRFLLLENGRKAKELLDAQAAALTPVVECTRHFSDAYDSLSMAVDTTLHDLPFKNLYIDEDRQQFLDKAVAHLAESEKLLGECTELEYESSSAAVQHFQDLRGLSKEIHQEISGSSAGLQELSSLLCHHTSLVQQATEEEKLGPARTLELLGLKP